MQWRTNASMASTVSFTSSSRRLNDLEWGRLFQTVREQPHSPYVVVVADFQQLQPVSGGQLCKKFCMVMDRIELKTIYRSTDAEHVLFLNRIREERRGRKDKERFGGRSGEKCEEGRECRGVHRCGTSLRSSSQASVPVAFM